MSVKSACSRVLLALVLTCEFSMAFAATDTSTMLSIALPKADASIPAELQAETVRQTVQGLQLYRNDTASAVASDSLVASGLLKGIAHPTGWLTSGEDPTGDLWTVAFTEEREGKPYAFADATVEFTNGKPKVSLQHNVPSRPIVGMESVLLHARDLAIKADFLRCANRYNQAVTLRKDNGSEVIDVDLLPARMDPEVYYLGGYHEFRYVVSGDAKPQHFAETKTCVTSSHEPQNALAMMVTHLTSPTPTQFHIFMSLSYGKPIIVLTAEKQLVWAVESGHMRVLRKLQP